MTYKQTKIKTKKGITFLFESDKKIKTIAKKNKVDGVYYAFVDVK